MLTSAASTSVVAGLVFGWSLIVAIGAQNTFVLRQGLLRRHVSTVVVICALSDVALIAAGVAGASAALHGRHWLLSAVRALGAAFLLSCAALATRRALHPPPVRDDADSSPSSCLAVVGACLAFTWLNPAVYLDTVVLLGSVANTRSGHQWWFGGGAALGSVLWFAALGYGARLLSPLFCRSRAWQVLDGFVAVVMAGTGVRVLLGG